MFEQFVRPPRDRARLRNTAYARGLDVLGGYPLIPCLAPLNWPPNTARFSAESGTRIVVPSYTYRLSAPHLWRSALRADHSAPVV